MTRKFQSLWRESILAVERRSNMCSLSACFVPLCHHSPWLEFGRHIVSSFGSGPGQVSPSIQDSLSFTVKLCLDSKTPQSTTPSVFCDVQGGCRVLKFQHTIASSSSAERVGRARALESNVNRRLLMVYLICRGLPWQELGCPSWFLSSCRVFEWSASPAAAAASGSETHQEAI